MFYFMYIVQCRKYDDLQNEVLYLRGKHRQGPITFDYFNLFFYHFVIRGEEIHTHLSLIKGSKTVITVIGLFCNE